MTGSLGDSPGDFIRCPGPPPCLGSLREEMGGRMPARVFPAAIRHCNSSFRLTFLDSVAAFKGGLFP